MRTTDPEDKVEGLIQGQVIEGRFHGPDLDLDRIDSDRADSDAGEGISALTGMEPEEEEELAETEAAVTP